MSFNLQRYEQVSQFAPLHESLPSDYQLLALRFPLAGLKNLKKTRILGKLHFILLKRNLSSYSGGSFLLLLYQPICRKLESSFWRTPSDQSESPEISQNR